MQKRINNLLLVSAILFFLNSCTGNVVFTDSAAMPSNTWELTNIPVFSVSVNDTVNTNNISFTIRNGSSYPYRNLFLFVTTTSPEGKSTTDTLQYELADERGRWLGKGFGDVHELILPYKSNVYFPVRGTYKIKVQHGMRMESLKGIYDIGIRVEKTGNQTNLGGKK